MADLGGRGIALRVIRMQWEAEDVLSVGLTTADGSDLPKVGCGAHVDVMLRPGLIRQYSLCGDPDDRREWAIAVLRETDGRGGSAYVHDELRPGAMVEVSSPRNNFELVESDSYLFIAGGIGITPLLPMVRRVAELEKDWRLLYGGRRRVSMAFLRDLQDLGERVTVAPEDEVGLLPLKEKISEAAPDASVYCCGPESLIEAVEQTCVALSRAEPHVERFGPRRSLPKDSANDGQFDIVLSRSGRRLAVPADKTIIEVLAEAGVFAPTSCTEGYCGACETQVLGGVPDHRDDYFTAEERQANDRMMICVGRSATSELVLKL